MSVADFVHFAEDHSFLGSCASFGADRDVLGGKGSAEPSTLLPSQVSQGGGVWKWSNLMYSYAVAKMMSLTMTMTTL